MSLHEEPLVRVERVSKKYCRSLRRSLWYGLRDLGGELAGRGGADRLRLRRDEFLAVDDVSFELRRGECLGLIGANGAGKSTLLKMLNGLVRPDAGRIEIRGRVGALIELGAGFNPILSGRENVYVNGAVLGMTKREVDARFDEIVEFAEIGEFIDSPVQSYSSGMRVRLGFAVAAHLEPDVLLVDEVLAVGDIGFQAKCLTMMSRARTTSGILFVSHDFRMISRLCDRVVCLEGGRSGGTEPPLAAIARLRRSLGGSAASESFASPEVALVSVRLASETSEARQGEALEVEIRFDCHTSIAGAIFNLAVYRTDGVHCFGVLSPEPMDFEAGGHAVTARIERLSLMPGSYTVSAQIWGRDRTRALAGRTQALHFTVAGNEETQGVFLPEIAWTAD